MSNESTRRTDNIRVKLAPDMAARVERMAVNYGMPTATLCAFAVAEWVAGKENQLQLSRMAVMDIGRKVGGDVSGILQNLANSPELEAAILQLSSTALSQPNLPLDGEAKPAGGA